MIIMLLGMLSDDEKNLVNKIFYEMNVKLYNISFGILHDRFDAEEAVAQTFLKIIDYIEKISSLPPEKVKPYCVIVLKNEATNIIRKRKNNACVEEIDRFEDETNYNMDEEYLKKADKENLILCIGKLSDEDKNIIHLRFVNDMNFKQLANILGISEETVKKRSQRILKKLRMYYEEGEKNVKCD